MTKYSNYLGASQVNRNVILTSILIGFVSCGALMILDDLISLEEAYKPLLHIAPLLSYVIIGFYVSRIIKRIRKIESRRYDEFCEGVKYASRDVRNKLILIGQAVYLHENMGDSLEDTTEIIKSNIKGAMKLLDDLIFEDEVIERLKV